MSKKTVSRHLVVNLTEDEITRCSQELARVTTQQAELEEEKKTVVSGFKEKIDRCISDSRCLARKISTRQDMREVECEWEMNYDLRIAKLIRLDTMEEVERRKLTADELQEELKFNQEPEGAAEEDEETSPQVFNNIDVCKNAICMNYSSVDTNGCSVFEHVYECEHATAEAPEVEAAVNCGNRDCADYDEAYEGNCGFKPADGGAMESVQCCEHFKPVLTDEQIEERDKTCQEWKGCAFADDCFSTEKNPEFDCLKDLAKRRKCPDCDYLAYDSINMVKHLRNHHGYSLKEATEKANVKEEDNDGITPEKIQTLDVNLNDKALKSYQIQISVAQGDTGAWYNAFHINTPSGGHGHAPYPKFSEQYPTRDEAIKAACKLAYNKAIDYVKDAKIIRKIADALATFTLQEAGK